MLHGILRKKYEQYLSAADIQINGTDPWDLQVLNKNLYARVFLYGSTGLGESYMDKWWECEDLCEFFTRLIKYRDHAGKKTISPAEIISYMHAWLFNLQKISRSRQIGKKHYDIDNRLFEQMLGSSMNYSCGYWKNAVDLETAQQAKMRLICEKLHLEKGMKVLDIGCGWGGMAKFIVENYGVSVVGITVSQRQMEYARKLCANLPVEIRIQDYRLVNEKFDRIYSVGMFEHVGQKNYRIYMQKSAELLNDDGLFLLHTIGAATSFKTTDPWIAKYIFPNSMLPSCLQISKAIEDLFIMEDWHNFGADYEETLAAWFHNFNYAWPELKAEYGAGFYRMWKYYLLVCAAAFRARSNQLWQIVLSPRGVAGGYRAPR